MGHAAIGLALLRHAAHTKFAEICVSSRGHYAAGQAKAVKRRVGFRLRFLHGKRSNPHFEAVAVDARTFEDLSA